MVIFTGLITASLTIYKQVRYFHSKDMGFDKRDLLVLYGGYRGFGSAIDAFRTQLKSNPSIIGVSASSQLPGAEGGAFATAPHKLDPSKIIAYQILSVDREFIETMKMNMISGQSFADVAPQDSLHGSILSETAVKAFGIKDPSSEMFQGERIYGVVRDFNMRSLRDEITPVVLRCSPQYVNEIAVRVSGTADLPKTVKFIEAKSMAFNAGQPMESQFFDDRLDELYGNDYRFAGMIGTFTAMAVFIACLGLLGVSLFVMQTRVKEIGIRKVMGASIGNVFYLVSKEFILLALLSAIVAIPVTTYVINAWLQNYAYRVSVDVSVVLYALLAAMIIVLMTISYQALRASRANPVDALRCE
jgi:putative ABC transport system permease protein